MQVTPSWVPDIDHSNLSSVVTRLLWSQAEEPAKTDSPSPAPAPALAAPQGPSLPFQMPKFQAPNFEKVQVPSFGTRQEPSSAPVAPPSPPPAPAAKVPFSLWMGCQITLEAS